MRADADAAVVVGRGHHAVHADVDGQGILSFERIGQAIADLVRERGFDHGFDHGRSRIDFAPAGDAGIGLDFY